MFIHKNIFRLSNLSIVNLENNDVSDFPHEIGMLKLKNLNLKGNPSGLVTSPAFRKVF